MLVVSERALGVEVEVEMEEEGGVFEEKRGEGMEEEGEGGGIFEGLGECRGVEEKEEREE